MGFLAYLFYMPGLNCSQVSTAQCKSVNEDAKIDNEVKGGYSSNILGSVVSVVILAKLVDNLFLLNPLTDKGKNNSVNQNNRNNNRYRIY